MEQSRHSDNHTAAHVSVILAFVAVKLLLWSAETEKGGQRQFM